MEKTTFDWHTSFLHTYTVISKQIISYSPKIAGVLVLLAVGWVVATLLRFLTKKLIMNFEFLFQYVAKNEKRKQEKIKRSYAIIISKIIFWVVILFFIAVISNMLNWQFFSKWINSLIHCLPNIIGGVIIILVGALVANIVKATIDKTIHSNQSEQRILLARLAQVVILFITVIIGVEQIGIKVDFLAHFLIVVVGIVLAGVALAFGFGAKTLVSNIIGAQYLRKYYRVGELLSVDGLEGTIIEITQTSAMLDVNGNRTMVPARFFQEKITCSLSS